jgi:hypothetical protein
MSSLHTHQTWLVIPTLSEAGAAGTMALATGALERQEVTRVLIVDNGKHLSGMTMPVGMSVYTPAENIGVGPAWNHALRLATDDDVIVFANDDITLVPFAISKLSVAVRSGAYMAGTQGHSFSLFAMSTRLVKQIGYFDEGFVPAYYEDTDYLRRMRIAGIGRLLVDTGTTHVEQSTSRDMGWSVSDLMKRQALRYEMKWGGQPGAEKFVHPWNVFFEVCVPSCRPSGLQRLMDSLSWQTVRPPMVTIVSNEDLSHLKTRGLSVRQLSFRSTRYAIGEGDVSLRRNIGTWASLAPWVVYSDDDQMWHQSSMEWFVRRFASGEWFVVGHHRFVDRMDDGMRNLPSSAGRSREDPPNAMHLWESCWGGCLGAYTSLVKSMGGWDLGYHQSEDQHLARRLVGEHGRIQVHEPPWAWHLDNAGRMPPWIDPHANVCADRQHDLVASDDGTYVSCQKCPLVRRTSGWGTVRQFNPDDVTVEERRL